MAGVIVHMTDGSTIVARTIDRHENWHEAELTDVTMSVQGPDGRWRLKEQLSKWVPLSSIKSVETNHVELTDAGGVQGIAKPIGL